MAVGVRAIGSEVMRVLLRSGQGLLIRSDSKYRPTALGVDEQTVRDRIAEEGITGRRRREGS